MIPQFALRLIVGLSLTWCLLPRRLITSGFFRIQMLVTLGLAVLATLTASDLHEGWPLTLLQGSAVGTALLSFVGSVLWTLERRRAGTWLVFLVTATASATLLLSQSYDPLVTAPAWLAIDDAFCSAGLLGTLVCAMLLGHWYLTATGMSLSPLVRATQLAFVAILLRALLATSSVWSAPAEIRAALWNDQFLWTFLRWTAGLLGPLLLTGLTFRILRYRNTQSATGMLFAAVILVFIGETAALLLRRELHWPL